LATVVDVAQRAGVSSATVSRVLSGRDPVAPETRERVMAAVRELAYQPNSLAQGLRLGRGRTVALVVGDIEQNVYSALTKHVQAALEEIGLDLLLFNLGHSEDRLQNLLERATAMRLRGIAIATADLIPMRRLKPLIDGLAEADIAVVAIGPRLHRHGVASIVYDEVGAGAEGLRHLLDRGHAPVAFLGRIKRSTTGRDRFRGYQKGLAEAGIAPDPALFWDCSDGPYRYTAGYEAMTKALDRGQRVGGVLAASDELALGAMAAALDRGLSVPKDVAFIGFGGIDWGAHVRPALTSFGADPLAIGRHLRDIFEHLENGGRVPQRILIDRDLIVRQST
jgi:DNA-binding LacI/PurR family transcriptional regulator